MVAPLSIVPGESLALPIDKSYGTSHGQEKMGISICIGIGIQGLLCLPGNQHEQEQEQEHDQDQSKRKSKREKKR